MARHVHAIAATRRAFPIGIATHPLFVVIVITVRIVVLIIVWMHELGRIFDSIRQPVLGASTECLSVGRNVEATIVV